MPWVVTMRCPMRISPARARTRPAIVRSKVVLPHPLGPTIARSEPCGTSRLTDRSTSAAS
jgi:hypothetical protein